MNQRSVNPRGPTLSTGAPRAGRRPRARTVLVCCFLVGWLPACGKQQVYEGLRSGKRYECQRYTEPDRSQCLQDAEMSYHDYDRERNERATP